MRVFPRVSRWVACSLAIVVVAAGLTATAELAEPTAASAISGSQFDPGNIISDTNFFNGNAMTQSQIQAFLTAQVGVCTDTNCLNVLNVLTTDKPAKYSDAGNLVCNTYSGSASEPAAAVIYKVQVACGISAKVILVTLQKEQGLVTKNSVSSGILERAMGYGCPDSTGGTCASTYYGFFNQIYWAAWQMKRYGTPRVFGSYQPGINSIQWSPNGSCGSGSVTIANRATAALYNYTPYQPNAAALANLSGLGDGCSAYGNRNFWVYYSNWFGSPNGLSIASPAISSIDSIAATALSINIAGWSVFPDSRTSSVNVAAQVGENWYGFTANQTNPGAENALPGSGQNHGFAGSISVGAGNYSVCIWISEQTNAATLVGCRSVSVPATQPSVNSIVSVTASAGGASIAGWSVWPASPNVAVNIAAQVGDNWYGFVADQASSAAAIAVPSGGSNHGFSGTIPLQPGSRNICIWVSQPDGSALLIGCRSVVVPALQPSVSSLDSVIPTATGVSISGWSVWPATPGVSVNVAAQVGGSWYGFAANRASSAASAAVLGAGENHGFAGTIPLPSGPANVCLWVSQPDGSASLLGCRSVVVPTSAPSVSSIDSVVAIAGGVNITGWSVWPQAPGVAVNVAAAISGKWYGFSANTPSAGAALAVPGSGGNHGFTGSVPLPAGTYQVCLWVSQPDGSALSIGCRSVVVSALAAAVSGIDSISASSSSVSFSGWAVWPDSLGSSVNIAVNVASQWVGFTANQNNAGGSVAVVGAGPNHGFAGRVSVSPGTHTVCIWVTEQSNLTATNAGCRIIVVPR